MSSDSGSPDACPPPLMWQDVRREFLAESTLLKIESPHGAVTARVWGEGAPLYLLPSFSSPAELYCLLVWLLRNDFQCVAVEPAFDQLPRQCWLMSDFGHLIRRLADELGHGVVSVFGANFGAAWGLAAARLLPERISRLMLLQGFAHRRLSFGERQLMRLCGLSSRKLAALPGRVAIQTQNQRRWFPPFDPSRWQYYLDATGGMPLRELSRRAQAVHTFDLRGELAAIAVPTLLIRTEGEGRVAGDCQIELERSLPRVQVEWLHTTGQLPYLTHPHRLAKLMRAFCAERSAEAIPSVT
jgi:pimeloyl-ACP methyl ester carboxylesterase